MKENLKIVVVMDWRDWHSALQTAVTEVDRKGQSGYTVAQCLDGLERRIEAGQTIVLLAIDLETGRAPIESVCGMCVLDFWLDFLGSKIACLTYGWIAKGYNRKVFEFAWPAIKALVTEQGCKAIWFFTHRDAGAFARWGAPMGFRNTYSVLTVELKPCT